MLRSMFPVWRHWDVKFTPKGIERRRRSQLARGSLLTAVLGFYIWSRRSPAAIPAIKAALVQVITKGLSSMIAKVNRLAA